MESDKEKDNTKTVYYIKDQQPVDEKVAEDVKEAIDAINNNPIFMPVGQTTKRSKVDIFNDFWPTVVIIGVALIMGIGIGYVL